MNSQAKRWEILHKVPVKSSEAIVNILLKNRGIKNKKEFFDPVDPMKITLKSLDIKESEVKKAVDRIKKSQKIGRAYNCLR